MKSFFRLALLILTASLVTAKASATTYYIAANGSDSNNGTSKTAPWLHAPGMPNCTSNCAATTPRAGDQLIFRGGDTWHFGNTGLATSSGGTWSWSWSGSSGSPIYIGIDQTWYSGSSWVRPILTGDNPLSSSFVASCSYDNYAALAAGAFFTNNGSISYVTLDNFDWQGRCWGASSGSYGGMIYLQSTPGHIIISNNYCHGWTTVDTSSDGYVCILGSGASVADFNQIVGNVFDGSDSSRAGTGSPHCKWGFSPCQSGGIIYQAAYDIHNNIFRYSSNFAVTTNTVTAHDNLFEFATFSYQSNGPHPNIINEDANVEGGNIYFYNNVIRHNNIGELFFFAVPHNHTLYFYNNVFFDNPGLGSPGNCVFMNSTQSGTSTAYFSNNTFDWGTGGCQIQGTTGNFGPPYSTNWIGTMYFENNHFVGYDLAHASPSIANAVTICRGGGPVCTFTDIGNEVFQTEAVANGQGYVASNNYAPTSSSNATVGAGVNLSSSCSTFSSDSTLCSGTSDGASEQVGAGGELANTPAIPMVARSSAWDAGAYQFGSGGQTPAPPTGLAASVQ
jgi:hypothetical protein